MTLASLIRQSTKNHLSTELWFYLLNLMFALVASTVLLGVELSKICCRVRLQSEFTDSQIGVCSDNLQNIISRFSYQKISFHISNQNRLSGTFYTSQWRGTWFCWLITMWTKSKGWQRAGTSFYLGQTNIQNDPSEKLWGFTFQEPKFHLPNVT